MLPGAGGSHSDADPADADAHDRADFEELQPDGTASRIGELGMRKPYPTQRAEQDIGEGGEPQAHLVGAHGCRGGAVGEQIELAFLYPVLHLAARAVDRFVEMPCFGLRGLERGDDKARVGRTAGPLGLATDATHAAPAVQRRPGEVAEASSWLAARFGLDARGLDFRPNLAGQPLIARQPEQAPAPERPSNAAVSGSRSGKEIN